MRPRLPILDLDRYFIFFIFPNIVPDRWEIQETVDFIVFVLVRRRLSNPIPQLFQFLQDDHFSPLAVLHSLRIRHGVNHRKSVSLTWR